jgi:hypothetical protein
VLPSKAIPFDTPRFLFPPLILPLTCAIGASLIANHTFKYA